jgi:prepilin-type N-terminal cleavage/methylation domain-containing protein
MTARHKSSGFTLIEVVIYLALFSILIGGLLVTAQGLWQNAGVTSSKVNIEEEVNFVNKKLDWALTGATAPTFTSNILKMTNHGKTYAFKFDIDEIDFCDTGTCPAASTNYFPITTQNVTVSSFSFSYLSTTKLLTGNFTINGIKVDITRYLRI